MLCNVLKYNIWLANSVSSPLILSTEAPTVFIKLLSLSESSTRRTKCVAHKHCKTCNKRISKMFVCFFGKIILTIASSAWFNRCACGQYSGNDIQRAREKMAAHLNSIYYIIIYIRKNVCKAIKVAIVLAQIKMYFKIHILRKMYP